MNAVRVQGQRDLLGGHPADPSNIGARIRGGGRHGEGQTALRRHGPGARRHQQLGPVLETLVQRRDGLDRVDLVDRLVAGAARAIRGKRRLKPEPWRLLRTMTSKAISTTTVGST